MIENKGVVSIEICNRVNILIEISGFILNNETCLQIKIADKVFFVCRRKEVKKWEH